MESKAEIRKTKTLKEVAAELGVSLPKAYELAKDPAFPVIRCGRRLIVPRKAFDQWLNTAAGRVQLAA